MNKKVGSIFEGGSEVLDILKNGESITDFLGFPSEKCALIGSEIQLVNILGRGKYGIVYSINSPDVGERLYAVKVSEFILEVVYNTHKKILKYMVNGGYTWEQLKKLQPREYIEKFENAGAYDYVRVVFPPKRCLQYDDRHFTNFVTGKKDVKVEAGSYLCDDETFSEYCIGAYLGTLYRERKCAHFFNVYSLFVCPENIENDVFEYKMYTFMDRIDGELKKYKSCISAKKFLDIIGHSQDMITSIYIQTIFAIAAYQDQFQISHNDLHLGNIFVEIVTPNTKFGGKNVIDADWYHYSFKDRNFYIPAVPVIVKIGDFGLSIKYKPPFIGQRQVFENGYDQGGKEGPWISNTYMPSYDNLYFSTVYLDVLPIFHKNKNFITECIEYMCPKLTNNGYIYNDLFLHDYIHYETARPVLKNLENVKTSADIINGPILEKYGQIQKGEIITLGKI